jgi:transposase
MKTSLGLDMAAASFAACLWFSPTSHARAVFPNTRTGFRRLSTWIKSHGVSALRVGLECTNTYGQAVAHWLFAQGHQVYLINPERTAHYAQARGQRNKTDPSDALNIATFVALHELTAWQPPSPDQAALCALTRTRADLVSQSQQLANQLRTAPPIARPYLKSCLGFIKQQIAAIEKKLRHHLKEHPALSDKVQLLRSIKGVGWLTAVIAIAELPNIDQHSDARAICAWAGLIPKRWQSGKTELPSRLSKRGNRHLRQALFMPALVAKKYNPLLHAFAEKLRSKGKRPGAIVGAVAHKMLRIIVGLLKSNSSFDPNWAFNKT